MSFETFDCDDWWEAENAKWRDAAARGELIAIPCGGCGTTGSTCPRPEDVFCPSGTHPFATKDLTGHVLRPAAEVAS